MSNSNDHFLTGLVGEGPVTEKQDRNISTLLTKFSKLKELKIY